MWNMSRVCPDCDTPLDAPSGPYCCETCWLVVPMSMRNRDGELWLTGRWMRLPPQLQAVRGIVETLRTVCRDPAHISAALGARDALSD